MFDVTLINLAADARSVTDSLAPVSKSGLTDEELKSLLQSFCEVDPVENAVSAPEIRVRSGPESYLLRTGQKKLMLFDVAHRELPALVLTLEEAMAELDGSARAARDASLARRLLAEMPELPVLPLPVHPEAVASKPRLIALGAAAFVLLGAIIYLQMEKSPGTVPAQFHAVEPAESASLQSSLTGVYMTGNQPGQHGIVFITADDLKLFELSARCAPPVVHASGKFVRVGSQLAVATDQPGGLIEITDQDTLVYCGEFYRRIP